MFILLLVFAGLVIVVVCALRIFEIRRNRAMDRLSGMVDFGEIEKMLVVWKAQNPDKNYSHPEAQRLIRACISEIARHRSDNPHGDAEQHISKLIMMLN
ncbi:MAG: hypothetical protein Q7R91_00250 [bacterium]|nr:hypothetical protein [bacterium]